MDPVTAGIGITAASSVYGAIKGDKTDKENRAAQQAAVDAQKERQRQIDSYVLPYLTSGADPFAGKLMELFAGGATRPAAVGDFTFAPAAGSQGFNTGQDSFMQMIRRGGQPFDTSELFSSLGELDDRALREGLSSIRGSTGSLGQRFGTANLNREANFRRDFLQNVGARNAGIRQSSYESAQGRVANAAGQLQSGGLSLMDMLNRAEQFNATQRSGAAQFNAGMGQGWNQFLAGLITQASNIENQRRGQNTNLLSIMAGLPTPGAVQTQPSQVPGAIGDLGQLLMFLPFLRQAGKAA